ncbi:hypothetical protein [Propionibacterium australiense]|uniref:hypothetical protein n=1 Tax=Propionibacterium australiense TaxID=119981 RepID=UPI000EF1C2C4|nr:hypothetical protein [Propionibacterium australiense]RLP10988.1 hypothetical protein D9T14_04400 [Propionibacterium australiense]VEH90971.1 Uncharacterised protein [Propionibacterium australiense]
MKETDCLQSHLPGEDGYQTRRIDDEAWKDAWGTSGTFMESFKRSEDEIAANPGGYRSIDIRIEYDRPPQKADSVIRLSAVDPGDRVPTRFASEWLDGNGVPWS